MNVLGLAKKRTNDYNNGYTHGFEKGVKAATVLLLFGVAQYLGDKRAWKRERIFQALQWLHKYADMILGEYTTFPEVREAVKEEYGIIEKDGTFYLLDEEEMKNG